MDGQVPAHQRPAAHGEGRSRLLRAARELSQHTRPILLAREAPAKTLLKSQRCRVNKHVSSQSRRGKPPSCTVRENPPLPAPSAASQLKPAPLGGPPPPRGGPAQVVDTLLQLAFLAPHPSLHVGKARLACPEPSKSDAFKSDKPGSARRLKRGQARSAPALCHTSLHCMPSASLLSRVKH